MTVEQISKLNESALSYSHRFQVFDREGDDGKFVSVTIKATDQGDPSLEGVCSFTVEITDVNDNPPLFDRQVNNKITPRDIIVLGLNFIIHNETLVEFSRNTWRTWNKTLVLARIFWECRLPTKTPITTARSCTLWPLRIRVTI